MVAQIERAALQGQLPAILEARHAADIMRGEIAADLDAEIPERHQLELELLAKAAIRASIPAEPPRCLALEFALAERADIGADHEGKMCSVSMPSACSPDGSSVAQHNAAA